MIVEIVVLAVASLAAGFYVGRRVPAAKLDIIEAHLQKFEATATADVKTLIARIRAVL